MIVDPFPFPAETLDIENKQLINTTMRRNAVVKNFIFAWKSVGGIVCKGCGRESEVWIKKCRCFLFGKQKRETKIALKSKQELKKRYPCLKRCDDADHWCSISWNESKVKIVWFLIPFDAILHTWDDVKRQLLATNSGSSQERQQERQHELEQLITEVVDKQLKWQDLRWE